MGAAEKIDDGRIALDLPLKGERKYLHSTNILSDLIARFSLTGPVKLEFRQMIYHPIYLLPGGADAPNRVGKFSFKDGDDWRSYAIYTDDSRQITGRVPDHEPEIIAAATRDGDKFHGSIDQPGNFINTIVALNKTVVGGHMGAGKKAIFTNISLDVIPGKGEIGIEMVKKMGNRIFVSDVIWNKAKIGSLTFMAV